MPDPMIFGRWMVTGPDFEDNTGWTLCLHVDRKCQRCLAEFNLNDDAVSVASLLHAADDHAVADSTTRVWASRQRIDETIRALK